jgi:hypothetical protein
MLGWFQAMMPKEGRFFDLFERHATIIVAGAEALRGLLQGGDRIEHHLRDRVAGRTQPRGDLLRRDRSEAAVADRRTLASSP